ncbi:hypothetical protein ES708_27134 [subsurface metagenome]
MKATTVKDNSKDELAVVKRNIEEFCRCVFEPDDIVEIRTLPSGGSYWCKAKEMAGWAERLRKENQAGQNIYIGINPRKQKGGTTAKDVALARNLSADFDNVTTAEEVKELLFNRFFPEPTIMIASGHGFHCHWRLTEPIKDLDKWTRLQKRLIVTLDSDPAIHDPAHHSIAKRPYPSNNEIRRHNRAPNGGYCQGQS